MTDNEKVTTKSAMDHLSSGERVRLDIKCRDDLHPDMLRTYGQCVQFIALWAKIHEPPPEGGSGMDFATVMNLFANNVSTCMMGNTEGEG